jgi:mRNA-degrading endonuclease RelE of RelBE toxin-antitoxin system
VEQGSQEKKIGVPEYRVLWHPETKKDLSKIGMAAVDSLVQTTRHRFSRAPHLIGQPLKGTTHLLWKIRFSKYRIIYTLNTKAKEVWVLSVQGRDEVYRYSHIQSLLRMAVALHEPFGRGR